MGRIAVLKFPGTNCDMETANAARAAGLYADILRWNCGPGVLKEYDDTNDVLEFTKIDCQIPVQDIYHRVDFS